MHQKQDAYFLPNVEIKDYSVMIDGWVFLTNQKKNDTRTYDGIKIATEKGDDYTSGCLVGYPYFKGNYKLIAIDIRKKQKQKQNLSLETQAVLLICSLELTISGLPVERTYQKSEKCWLCEE